LPPLDYPPVGNTTHKKVSISMNININKNPFDYKKEKEKLFQKMAMYPDPRLRTEIQEQVARAGRRIKAGKNPEKRKNYEQTD